MEPAEKRYAQQWYVLWTIAIAGMLLSAILALSVLEVVRQTKDAELQSRVTDLVGRVETELNVQMTSLRAFRSFMDVRDDVAAQEFSDFAANLRASDIGTIAYGWAAKDTSSPSFIVQMLDPPGQVPALLGMDLISSAYIREAMHNSIDFDAVQISEPLNQQRAGSTQNFILAMYPLFQRGVPNFLVEQRRRNIQGILFSVLDLQSTIGYVVSTSSYAEQVDSGYVGIEVINQSAGKAKTPVFRAGDFDRLAAAAGTRQVLRKTLISERDLKIAQRTVRFQVAVDDAGLDQSPYISAALALLIGLIVTGGMVVAAWSRANYEKHVAAVVAERTRALENSEQRLRDLADVSADWFWELDSELRFTYLSERFQQVTGLSRTIFLGRTRIEAVGIHDLANNEKWKKHLDDMENHRPFNDFRYHMVRTGSVDEYLSISGKPIFDKDGEFQGYRGTGRDVTSEEAAQRRLKESETRLHRNVEQLEMSRQDLEENTAKMAELAERYAIEKDRAEASEKSKSEFLASMSHEIRTPMTGVMGFADMLLDSSLASEDREKVIKIKGATQSLLTIINDILDLSKLDAGRLNIENLDFNLKSAVEEVLDLVRERARVKKLKLSFEFPDDMPEGIHSDPTRFRQILINLVGNAVKFTHTGGVTIKAAMTGRNEARFIEFRVIDSGIGIAEENRKKLFSDFSQADASITRQYEGTGLGLSISKRLVELMGGRIWVESKEDVGSEFCFTLPFTPATTDVSNAARLHHAEHFNTTRPLHILVAEDNKLNQRIIVATLDKFGHKATVVGNGEEATVQVDKEEYDLILMDIRMPEMSGTDATRVIRARRDALADIPIIALTADAMEEHIQGYIAAGMNACATKPIDRSALAMTINEVLGEEIHVALSEAEIARSGYALPTEDETDIAASGEQAEVISVADFLSQLETVADEIERDKKART